MNILEALSDKTLFGGLKAFRNLSTWRPWLTFLGALYGLELEADGVERFKKHTGRSEYVPPPGGWREAVVIVGRQSGKSRVAACIAGKEAVSQTESGTYAALVGQDHRAALRVVAKYAREPFEAVAMLRRSVADTKSDSATLKNGVTLAAYPCRPQAVRGLRCCVVVCDELAHFKTSDGVAQDREMLTALRPTLATTGGRLIILNSPYHQTGVLWELYRQHHGRDDSPVLIWQASAPDMNPTLSESYLASMAESDPAAYRSEVLGEFRQGLSSLFDSEALDGVVTPYTEQLWTPGHEYAAFVDPSGGRGDSFTLAIGHRRDGRIIVDRLRAWKPPFNPSGVVAEVANLAKSYHLALERRRGNSGKDRVDHGPGAHDDLANALAGLAHLLSSVTGDRYSGEWVAEAFRLHELAYKSCEVPKSDLYLALLASVNSHALDVPDVPDLLRELRGGEEATELRFLNPAPRSANEIQAEADQEFEERYEAAQGAVRDAIQSRGVYWP